MSYPRLSSEAYAHLRAGIAQVGQYVHNHAAWASHFASELAAHSGNLRAVSKAWLGDRESFLQAAAANGIAAAKAKAAWPSK